MHKLAKMMLTLGVVSAVFAGCNQGYSRNTFAPGTIETQAPVTEAVLKKAGLQLYWKSLSVALNPNERLNKMYSVGENVYFVTNHKRLIAVDGAIGVYKWSCPITDGVDDIFGPIHYNSMRITAKPVTFDQPVEEKDYITFDAVLINTNSRLVIINRKNGKVVRNFRFTQPASSQGTTDGNRYYYSTARKNLLAVKLNTNASVWEQSGAEEVTVAPLVIKYGTLYSATFNGVIDSYMCSDVRMKNWTRKLEGGVLNPYVADENRVYVAAQNNCIYVLDKVAGLDAIDPIHLKGRPKGAIQVTPNSIIQYVEGVGLQAFNKLDGSLRWTKPTARKAVATIDEKLYILDADNALHAVNEISGDVSATIQLTGMKFISMNPQSEIIYAATKTGQIFCICSKNSPRLTADMIKQLGS